MKRLCFSTAKYQYLVENIDFLDLILTEQVTEKTDQKIDVNAFAEFLTTSIYNKKGEVELNVFLKQEKLKKELALLQENLNDFENKEEDDKVIHFLNHLMGSLNLESEEVLRMIPVLLEYVEYHKVVKEDEKIR